MTDARFGPYLLREPLGRGGMGEVWRAVDTRKDREVALKVLGAWLGGDPQFADRFRREAALAARLTAPHIVPIHDYGEIDGRLFIDMALISGADLGKLLAHGPLPTRRAVGIVVQVARALGTAHAAGLVHRDVKPANILVTTTIDGSDHAYLIDFGILRALDGTRLSMTGSVIGTPAYMAPECFLGDGDARSDIYALGCVLHELLTGRPPFDAPHPFAFAHVHQNLPPPRPSEWRPELPPALDDVVARALAKAPDDRFGSVGELAAAAQAAAATRVATPGRTTHAAATVPPTRTPTAPPTWIAPSTAAPARHAAPSPAVPAADPGEPPEARTAGGRVAAASLIVVGALAILAGSVLDWDLITTALRFTDWSLTWPVAAQTALAACCAVRYARRPHAGVAVGLVAAVLVNVWAGLAVGAVHPYFQFSAGETVGRWVTAAGGAALLAGLLIALRTDFPAAGSRWRGGPRAVSCAVLVAAGAAGETVAWSQSLTSWGVVAAVAALPYLLLLSATVVRVPPGLDRVVLAAVVGQGVIGLAETIILRAVLGSSFTGAAGISLAALAVATAAAAAAQLPLRPAVR